MFKNTVTATVKHSLVCHTNHNAYFSNADDRLKTTIQRNGWGVSPGQVGSCAINTVNSFVPKSHASIPMFILLLFRYDSIHIRNSRQTSLKIENLKTRFSGTRICAATVTSGENPLFEFHIWCCTQFWFKEFYIIKEIHIELCNKLPHDKFVKASIPCFLSSEQMS